MKPQDLVAVLHDHADLPETAHAVRMAGLRSRVRKVRRRRAFVAMACALLVLVGGAVVSTRSLPDSQPAKPDPFPQYVVGSRIVAQTSGRTPDPLTLAFTPSDSADLTLFIGCDNGTGSNLKAVLSVDGKEVQQTPCHRDATGIATNETHDLLVAGKQSVIRLTVLGRITSTGTTVEDAVVEPVEDGIGLRLGVGRKVPLAEYPMPPAPPEPVEVDRLVYPADVVLRSDPADPNLPQKVVVPWRAIAKTHVVLGSPGRITVLVGGETVNDITSFGYGPTGSMNGAVSGFPDFAPGQPVEISVVPEAQHGEWAVMVDMAE